MITVVVYIVLLIFGLSLGSFVNALVWRLHEQERLLEEKPKGIGTKLKKLSITRGRSMCTHCNHELAPKDLVPVFSWLWLRGKCRYCQKPINDTPFTELALPALMLLSYVAWPYSSIGWTPLMIASFAVWSIILTCFLALAVYDTKWQLLPNKIVVPVTVFVALLVGLLAYELADWTIARDAIIAGAAFFGLFYAMYQISDERWIGGGDVKLALSLGMLAGSLLHTALLLFIASVLGLIAALPGIVQHTRSVKSAIPFGPFLIAAGVIVFLWGAEIQTWYFESLTVGNI